MSHCIWRQQQDCSSLREEKRGERDQRRTCARCGICMMGKLFPRSIALDHLIHVMDIPQRVFPPLYTPTGDKSIDRLAFIHVVERLKVLYSFNRQLVLDLCLDSKTHWMGPLSGKTCLDLPLYAHTARTDRYVNQKGERSKLNAID